MRGSDRVWSGRGRKFGVAMIILLTDRDDFSSLGCLPPAVSGKKGQNVRRHSLARLNASMIKPKKTSRVVPWRSTNFCLFVPAAEGLICTWCVKDENGGVSNRSIATGSSRVSW